MIRSKTTFVIGGGASAELHMPGPAEILDRIGQALDFSRGGDAPMTRDSAAIVRHMTKLAARLDRSEQDLLHASQRIFQAAKVSRSIEDVIAQSDDEPLVAAFGKLAIAVFTLQAESRSSLRPTPQPNGVLPLQTGDYWLIELGRMIVAGLPRSQLEQGLANITIVSFNYDRAVEHFVPYIVATAYGMPLHEAQRIVAANLTFHHPCGTVGRLPWQAGDAPAADWGNEQPEDMVGLSDQIRTLVEAASDEAALAPLRASVAGSRRMAFLGFDFAAPALELMFAGGVPHDPDIVVSFSAMSASSRIAAVRALRHKIGADSDDRVLRCDGRSLDLLTDYALLLES